MMTELILNYCLLDYDNGLNMNSVWVSDKDASLFNHFSYRYFAGILEEFRL